MLRQVRGPEDEGTVQEVLVVHRPEYDDWSLPKGKLDAGEVLPACAVREVAEETGVTVRLTAPLEVGRYDTSRGPKEVHWWRAVVVSAKAHTPDDEVDQVRWVPVGEAYTLLDYDDERDRVRQAVAMPTTVPLIVTRHGKAMLRKNWSGKDAARPLTSRGRIQSRELMSILAAYGVRTVVTSSSNRCVSTVLPYADHNDLTIHRRSALSEEKGVPDPDTVVDLIGELRARVLRTGKPMVVCGHRPVLPSMLTGLELPDRHFRTAESVIVHLTPDDTIAAVEWIRTPT